MCEVAVCKGDVGWHARTCSRVSRCECHVVVCESRDTRKFERESGMETTTATVERQGPGSGSRFIGDRAGFTRQRAGGPCRATHEAPTCSAVRVRPGPETHAVDVADRADGQRPGWVAGFGLDGFSTRTRVCSVKPRKVGSRSTSPERRAVLNQAADESFVSGQKLRWAEEGLCMTEDSQSETGFGGKKKKKKVNCEKFATFCEIFISMTLTLTFDLL